MVTSLTTAWQRTTQGLSGQSDESMLEVKIVSFGYKSGPPPHANMLFDVRFLDNPYWVEALRPLTGLDRAVQEYVIEQPLAQHFLHSLIAMASEVLPEMSKRNAKTVTIAFGCTGGQHRSASIAEYTAAKIRELFPRYMVRISHRELDGRASVSEDGERSPVEKIRQHEELP
jgi:RNase adapter protein RapZ